MRINRKLLHYCRLIHIYLSMFGLLVILLFGVTGFTINHEAWFGATKPHVTELTGSTPKTLIDKNDSLHIVEHLRNTFQLRGAMNGYDDLDDTIAVGFKSPGESWEVEIDKSDGATRARGEAFNTIAVLNNLHRGRYAGAAWGWIIDITAILIMMACATGIVLWLVLPKRRKIGLAALAVGVIGTWVVYALLVPGADAKIETKPTPSAEQSE